MKRIFDILFSALLLIILSPVFLIIILAIKLNSKGPVFFTQERIGKDNVNFKLFKFRTMKIGTPNVATELLNDSQIYITGVGKILRKSSMDELPQIINILKGEMTFVGPRPALYNQYDLKELRTQKGVQKLVPGVTGWAQVNGRDALSNEEKVYYDQQYLLNKSIVFDVKILIKTVFKVLRADGVIEGGNKKVVDNKSESI